MNELASNFQIEKDGTVTFETGRALKNLDGGLVRVPLGPKGYMQDILRVDPNSLAQVLPFPRRYPGASTPPPEDVA